MSSDLNRSDLPEIATDDHPDRRRRRLIANRAFGALKAQHNAERGLVEAAADSLNDLASSTPFLLLHLAWFVIWIPWNLGWLGFEPFDPFPFGLLTMIVSLEAIFLSCFVLISQNRQAEKDRVRADIEYDVNIQAELEIAHLHEKTDRMYAEMLEQFLRLEKGIARQRG